MKTGLSLMDIFNTITLIFIAAKLFGKITWSWFWVLSPTILSISLTFLILLLIDIIKEKRKKGK